MKRLDPEILDSYDTEVVKMLIATSAFCSGGSIWSRIFGCFKMCVLDCRAANAIYLPR